MRVMMMKNRGGLKIMSGPGDTRGRGVLGHDRGSPHTLVLVVLLMLVVLLVLLILVVQLVQLILVLRIIVHLILVQLTLVLGHDWGSPHTLILSSSSSLPRGKGEGYRATHQNTGANTGIIEGTTQYLLQSIAM